MRRFIVFQIFAALADFFHILVPPPTLGQLRAQDHGFALASIGTKPLFLPRLHAAKATSTSLAVGPSALIYNEAIETYQVAFVLKEAKGSGPETSCPPHGE